jgi:hypothetical protein
MQYVFIIMLLISSPVFSHPVIYKGGTMIGSSNMPFYSDNQANYSFDTKWAVWMLNFMVHI